MSSNSYFYEGFTRITTAKCCLQNVTQSDVNLLEGIWREKFEWKASRKVENIVIRIGVDFLWFR